MLPAVIGASAALVVAFLSRLPALTPTGRRQAALKRDLELLAAMPPGAPRSAFEGFVNDSIAAHLAWRADTTRGRTLFFRIQIAMISLLAAAAVGAAQFFPGDDGELGIVATIAFSFYGTYTIVLISWLLFSDDFRVYRWLMRAIARRLERRK